MMRKTTDQRGVTLADTLVALVIVALLSVLMVSLLSNLAILKNASAGLNLQGRGLPKAYHRAASAIAAMDHPDRQAANARLQTLGEDMSDDQTAYRFKVTGISGNGYNLDITIAPRGLRAETYQEVIYAAPTSTETDETTEPAGHDPD
ncbi:hypothetical protein [Pseudoramibacter porci]|uniref:Type II secretion system protein n=1 Tax=Pseudoramibacter porci TaxID=2606631 RepID=A0A7X2TB43_9FIRM|nr:hypothetical protein [Pseudoramibacter porci]MSS20423.1 hypothetical protein [Pseudoramibacter porci]